MFWTVLAVGLGAHGWWSGSWIEIGFGILAGVIGVRKAVVAWDKPGAFMNCVATVVASGFLIASMARDDNEKASALIRDLPWRAIQKQSDTSTSAREREISKEEPKSKVQMFPSMDELAEGSGSIRSTMEMWPMASGKEYIVDKQGKECAIQVQWEGAPMSEGALRIEINTFPYYPPRWVGYEQAVVTRSKENSPWLAHGVRATVVENVRNLKYMLWCSEERTSKAEQLERETSGKLWVTPEKGHEVKISNGFAEFVKPANCMMQITSTRSPPEHEVEYQKVGMTYWERYDWHVQYGEEALIWDELKLRVVAKAKEPQVWAQQYCREAGPVAWRPLIFGERVSDGTIQDGADSERVNIGTDHCLVRLKFITHGIDAGEIFLTTKNGAGRDITVPYNALSLMGVSDDFYVTVKRGQVRDGMTFALECPKYQ